MKQDIQTDTESVSVSVSLGLIFVIINSLGIKINADVNAKNQLIKDCMIKDLFRIVVIASVNVINHAMLESIQTMKIVTAKKIS